MAFDMFLKIDGIPGESTESKHKGEIEILSYSFGVENSGAVGGPGGGAGAGKATFQDFHFVSRLQKSSPELFNAAASGEHIKQAVLSVRRAGGNQQDYYKVTLSDVLVSSFKQAGDADSAENVPLEEVSLNFAKIKLDYSTQNAKGQLGDTVSAEWDIRTNKGS